MTHITEQQKEKNTKILFFITDYGLIILGLLYLLHMIIRTILINKGIYI